MEVTSLFDLKENLVKTFGYEEGLAETISMAVDSVALELGEEYRNTIVNAIMSCKVVVANDNNVNSIKSTLESIGMYDEREAKLTSGGYTSVARISNQNGTYKIDKVDRTIVLPHTFNIDNPASISTLVGEILRLAKASIGEYSLDQNRLIKRNGLASATSTISLENGVVKKEVLSEKGAGLESGLTDYDTLKIMRNNYDDNFDLTGNDYARIVGGYLEDAAKLKDVIHAAEITKNEAVLKQILNSSMTSGYDGFISLMDENHKLETRRKSLLDGEEIKKAMAELMTHYQNSICPQVNALTANVMQREKTQRF